MHIHTHIYTQTHTYTHTHTHIYTQTHTYTHTHTHKLMLPQPLSSWQLGETLIRNLRGAVTEAVRGAVEL